jgi:hypothetical protein
LAGLSVGCWVNEAYWVQGLKRVSRRMQWKGDIIEGFETDREYVGGGVTSFH